MAIFSGNKLASAAMQREISLAAAMWAKMAGNIRRIGY